MKTYLQCLALLMGFITISPAFAEQVLRISCARSLCDTGILDELVTGFHELNPGVKTEVQVVGAVEAIERGRQGRVDFIISHYPLAEQLFVEEGYGVLRTQILYSECALFGPAELRLKYSEQSSMSEVLKAIKENEEPFLVPSPRSGTYRKIQELWANSSIEPDWIGYENTGSSANATLLAAAEFDALTIADMGLYLLNKKQLANKLVPLYRGDLSLRNEFYAIVVNPDTVSGVNARLAESFLDYLVSSSVQDRIQSMVEAQYGMGFLVASAHLDDGLRARRAKALITQQQQQLWILSSFSALLVIMSIVGMLLWLRYRNIEQKRKNMEIYARQVDNARKLAVQADTIKNELISMVSHELRTPLTSVIGALGMLNSNVIPSLPKEAKELLDIACRNSERLLFAVNDLLDIEKIDSGKLELNEEPVDLQQLIAQSLQENRPLAEVHNIRLEQLPLPSEHTESVAAKYCTMGDKGRLLQVLGNLISNAIKFSPEHSVVSISLERKGNIIRLSVADQGFGIPKAYAKHVFDRFTQIEALNNRSKGGTGLGLAISKALIELHCGYIGYYDNSPTGTVFYVELHADENCP